MKIIIEGSLVETKDIWDIVYTSDSRHAKVVVKLIDKDDIVIKRDIPYDRTSYNVSQDQAPYKRLYEELKNEWEKDRQDLKVFKI